MIIVFYDGKCGLCSKEINHYKAISPSGIFRWEDINMSYALLEKDNVALADGLRQLHALDAAGKMHVGADAFILIWKQLKGWKVIGKVFGFPIIRQVVGFLYRIFANYRFNSLSHCQVAHKDDGNDV